MPLEHKVMVVAKEFTPEVDHLMSLMAKGHDGDVTISACVHPLLFQVSVLQPKCQNFFIEHFKLYFELVMDSKKII